MKQPRKGSWDWALARIALGDKVASKSYGHRLWGGVRRLTDGQLVQYDIDGVIGDTRAHLKHGEYSKHRDWRVVSEDGS